MSLPQREARASESLERGRYSEAIADLKALLKADPQPDRERRLKSAYASHIDALVEAGKNREAVSAWEAAARDAGFSLDHPRYGVLLLAVGRNAEAISRYLRLRAGEAPPDLRELSARLAARALAEGQRLIASLPPDDPVAVDFPTASELLEAYCEGDDDRARRLAKKIAFRSPYRDLRVCALAMLDLETAPDKARDGLGRIDESSPFYPLAHAAGMTLLEPPELLPRLGALSLEEQQLIEQIRGWPTAQRALRKKLSALPEEPSPVMVFQFCASFRDLAPEYLATAALNAVIQGGTSSRRGALTLARYNKRFGPLDRVEGLRAIALMSLRDPHLLPGDVDRAWCEYIWELFDSPNRSDLAVAVVQRHIVDSLNKLTGSPLNENGADNLRCSLNLDPWDPPTYFKLLTHYLEVNQLKSARETLKLGLAHYPDDIEMLLMAIRVAVAGKAFKKAAGYAKKILAVDPINREARRLLQQAHLSHARKQIKTKKWHLLRNEIEQARLWGDEDHPLAVADLLESVAAEAESGKAERDRLLRRAAQRLGGSIRAQFTLLYEASLYGQNGSSWLARAGVKRQKGAEAPDEILALLPLVAQYLDEDGVSPAHETIEWLEPALTKSARLDFSRKAFEQLCGFWVRVDNPHLLGAYAKQACQRWPDNPLFEAYLAASVDRLGPDAMDRLEERCARAARFEGGAFMNRVEELLDWAEKRYEEHVFSGISEDSPFTPPSELDMIRASIPSMSANALITMFTPMLGEKALRSILAQGGIAGLRAFLVDLLDEIPANPGAGSKPFADDSEAFFTPDLFE
ncbi:MAG TPA: hypothetical protein ENK26_13110 [Gammaproteobacteria bacterium]|nr:hypothetical protein [Gammaproteobacteria bacterium]